jgi:hypothetical protein
VQTTVEGLVDLEKDQMPFKELGQLSDSITLLPKRDGLPTAFDAFLTQMKWPGGFEMIERKRVSGYELATILVFAVTAIGSLLLIVPREAQEAFYNILVSFAVAQGGNVIGVGALLVGVLYWPIVVKYDTHFGLLIRNQPHRNGKLDERRSDETKN